ncbi:divergent polysaccharide deacetylase family protein [Paenibacillus sp. ACRRX]|uniref:divergent polysaccharide deacetylase family protein n=1 Tax=Paenibacillus sp. ACRRX TaxID=2918206 RepID=UPI001EF70CE3|nr:divergent polysaccharide deacetylase family protein [Paenibacillus sp. ACRRX]MCG7406110.1 divergent polysaccharide deacetylase family protein [Paenibacillus sp. ACRRX]
MRELRNAAKGFNQHRKARLELKISAAVVAVLIAMMACVPTIGAAIPNEQLNLPQVTNLQAIQDKKSVAIVIDDFGNKMKGTELMLKLPVHITVAVMPFLQTSVADAKLAHQMGHEVIVHMPMEPKSGKASWLGPGAILSSQSDEEIEKRIRTAIDAVPHAVGMNNHMGSKITGDKRVMRVVLRVIKEKGMYFLDSKTNYRSVIGEVAKEIGVPVVNNQIFLDDVYSESHVTKQWSKVLDQLKSSAACITIGHVGAGGLKTAAVLHRQVPQAMKDVHFVRISELVKR